MENDKKLKGLKPEQSLLLHKKEEDDEEPPTGVVEYA